MPGHGHAAFRVLEAIGVLLVSSRNPSSSSSSSSLGVCVTHTSCECDKKPNEAKCRKLQQVFSEH